MVKIFVFFGQLYYPLGEQGFEVTLFHILDKLHKMFALSNFLIQKGNGSDISDQTCYLVALGTNRQASEVRFAKLFRAEKVKSHIQFYSLLASFPADAVH